MKFLTILILFLTLNSCSGVISKIHRDLDRADGKTTSRKNRKKNKRDHFARFRNPYYSKRDTSSIKNQSPKVRREYKSAKKIKRRYTVDDLADNQSDGSLWSGRGNNNYLFSLDQERKNGDIIVINIFDRLKKDITVELKRSAAQNRPRKSKNKKQKNGDKDTKAKKVVKAPPKKDGDDDSAFDRISSVIIEKINKDHFLLRGQKQILYKNKKRIIEIQALIAKRDIDATDSVHSDKLLESTIYLVR